MAWQPALLDLEPGASQLSLLGSCFSPHTAQTVVVRHCSLVFNDILSSIGKVGTQSSWFLWSRNSLSSGSDGKCSLTVVPGRAICWEGANSRAHFS